jgi:hypothetical protein
MLSLSSSVQGAITKWTVIVLATIEAKLNVSN